MAKKSVPPLKVLAAEKVPRNQRRLARRPIQKDLLSNKARRKARQAHVGKGDRVIPVNTRDLNIDLNQSSVPSKTTVRRREKREARKPLDLNHP